MNLVRSKGLLLLSVTWLFWLSSVAASDPVAVGVVNAKNVNVRSRADLKSEVLTRVSLPEEVQVLEQITLENPAEGLPAEWLRIQVPSKASLWVSALFVDKDTGMVLPPRLNVRSGPGENHAVVDRIAKGTVVKSLGREGDWIKIEPTATSAGYIAASFVDLQAATEGSSQAITEVVEDLVEPETPQAYIAESAGLEESEQVDVEMLSDEVVATETETESVVAAVEDVIEEEPVAASNSLPLVEILDEASVSFETEESTTQAVEESTLIESLGSGPMQTMSIKVNASPVNTDVAPATMDRPAASGSNATLVKKRSNVIREGTVGKVFSIQSPSKYKLKSIYTGKTINFLSSDSPYLNLERLKGTRIRVVGDELIDSKWPRTPVLEVKKIVLVR